MSKKQNAPADDPTLQAFHNMLLNQCAAHTKAINARLARLREPDAERSWALCSTLQATENLLKEAEENLK